MHRLFVGKDARMVTGAVHSFVALLVLVMHLFAFPVMGWPGNIAQKYPQYTAPPPGR